MRVPILSQIKSEDRNGEFVDIQGSATISLAGKLYIKGVYIRYLNISSLNL